MALTGRLAEQRPSNLMLHMLGRQVLATLGANDVPAVMLKGTELSLAAHGSIAARDVGDLDVLVAHDDFARADRALESLGFEPAAHQTAEQHGRAWLHREYEHRCGGLPTLEVHWRLHWLEEDYATAAIGRARCVSDAPRLQPADELVAMLLYYARDGFSGLRLAADLAGLWDRLDPSAREHAPSQVADIAAAHPELEAVLRCAAECALRVVGLPRLLPAATSRGASLALRLMNWDLRGDIEQVRANARVIDLLLARPELVRSTATRHWTAPELPLPARLTHPLKLMGRGAIALNRLGRGRAFAPLPGEFRAACRPDRQE